MRTPGSRYPDVPAPAGVGGLEKSFRKFHRQPIISQPWRDDLHAYLGGILRDLGGVAQQIGGTADHVHILAGLKATHCLADVLRDIKSGSSRWIHDEKRIRSFDWQEGYGAVTVSPSGLTRLRRYIVDRRSTIAKRHFRTNSVSSWTSAVSPMTSATCGKSVRPAGAGRC